MATLKQSYSSCITDCQHDFEKRNILKTSSNKYWRFLSLSMTDVINDSWLLILKISGYLAVSFYRFHALEQQKLIKTDGSGHAVWPAPREGKVLWKTTTKIKVLFTGKKVLYFKESFTFQSKCSITWNRKFHLSKRKYYK